ncbi:MAG: hypothetical protein H7A32_00860 [Deltaproteobacteria bacterium]|nr:hypothetical protein [Deltaproteobacteria bacterium]
MKNNFKKSSLFLSLPILFILTLFFILPACQNEKAPSDISHYTCPMHPQIKMDQPGSCPICGMDLIPVRAKQESVSKKAPSNQESQHSHTNHQKMDHSQQDQKDAGIEIDPERIQQIGVKSEKIQMHELHKTLLLQGKVAHDPKLWVAQKEYVIALKLGDRDLIKSSEEKLYFMGLSKEWIRLIQKTRKANLGFHLPVPGELTFFEAFLYQEDVKLLQVGAEMEIYDLQSRKITDAIIRALGTIVDPESQTVRVLLQAKSSLEIKPNTIVQLKVKLDLGQRLAIAKSAILFNGDHNMVYIKTESGKILGKKIELGQEAGDYYEIKSGLQKGDEVITHGHFLLDSETQIKMGGN